MTSGCLDRKEVRGAIWGVHSTTDRPAGGNTGRLFLTFGGPVCADRFSNCPLDRVLTYKNLIYLLNLQICYIKSGSCILIKFIRLSLFTIYAKSTIILSAIIMYDKFLELRNQKWQWICENICTCSAWACPYPTNKLLKYLEGWFNERFTVLEVNGQCGGHFGSKKSH